MTHLTATLYIANVTPERLAALASTFPNLPACSLTPTVGVCAPWPVEHGTSATFAGMDAEALPTVRAFARHVCQLLGEQCAALDVRPAPPIEFVTA